MSRETIVAAAAALAERSGLDMVTLRAVAAEVGVTPMALYRYVPTSEALLDLVVEELMLRERSVETRWPKDWQGRVRLVAGLLRTLLSRHPMVLSVIQRRAIGNPVVLDHLEPLLDALARAGFSREQAADFYAGLLAFVVGFVSVANGREAARIAAGRTVREQQARTADLLQSLTADRYPRVRAAAEQIAGLLDERHFTNGVDRLIAGAEAAARTRSRKGRAA